MPAASDRPRSGDRGAGEARLRKVCGRALAKMRRLAGKEAGVFGRDAWAGASRAVEEAGGATGCGGLRAWGRAELERGALHHTARRARVECGKEA